MESITKRLYKAIGKEVSTCPPTIVDCSQGQETGSDGVPFVSYENLQFLSERELDSFFSKVSSKHFSSLFLIAEGYSPYLDPTGTNFHKTSQPAEWWLEKLQQAAIPARLVKKIGQNVFLFSSWELSEETKRDINWLVRRQRMTASIRKLPFKLAAPILMRQKRFMAPVSLAMLAREKKIALVGNAKRLSDYNFGEEIDAHDIVVRMNSCPIIEARSHGTKTHWVAASGDFTKDVMEARSAKIAMWMTPKRNNVPPWFLFWPQRYLHPVAETKKLRGKACVNSPTTGLMVFDLLRNTDCAQLTLYGFDFFNSLSSSGHRQVDQLPHDFEMEKAYVEKHVAEDTRLELRW